MLVRGMTGLKKILIVEDDRDICSQLAGFLGNNGYQCEVLEEYVNVPQQIVASHADLVLLDIMLPGADGGNILRQLRKDSDVPVIMVTSKNTEMDEVLCMSYGADDFIAKPYNTAILLLHIEAVLKRLSGGGEDAVITYENIRLDVGRGRMEISLSDGKRVVDLTKNEMRILQYLIQNQGSIVTRDQLMGYLWDSQEFVDDNTLTVNINRVRTKLKENGVEELIRTKRGMGYVLG